MTVDFMRWCDKWLGKPFAFLVWLISPLLHRRCNTPPGHIIPEVRRIMVIKLFGMGSLLLATPSFRALRKAYPGASLEMTTASKHLPFIRSLQIFDRSHGIPLSGLGSFLGGMTKLFFRPRPDICINLEYYTWFTIALQTLLRARVRVGFAERQWLRLRLLDIAVYFNHHHHITRIFSAVAEQLGAVVRSESLSSLNIKKHHSRSIQRRLQAAGYDFNRPLVSLHIGVSPLCRLRQWPLARFQKLVHSLQQKSTVFVILIGGPEEKEEADAFISLLPASPRLLNWVGRLSIEETLEVLRRSALLITNDSGPLHWAVALKIPTVSFFGPETPQLYGPPPDPQHRVFYSRRYCSPCLTTTYAKTSPCRDNLCLQDIGVSEVLAAVMELLDKKGKAG